MARMPTPAPFLTRVHYYPSPTRHSCAYESGALDAPNAIIAIGGLGDGPHTVLYFHDLATRLDATKGPSYSVFQLRLKSSFIGYGTSSLAEDVVHISALVPLTADKVAGKKIALLGHSTGSQVCLLRRVTRTMCSPRN